MRWLLCGLSSLAVVMGPGTELRADFVRVGEIQLTTPENHHGIAFDGANWHIANAFFGNFRTYTPDFQFVSTTTVAGVQDLRGLTYDPNSSNLFISNAPTSVVREVTVQGSVVSQFTAAPGGGLNALAFDPRDNTIWLAYFSGVIENRTRTGTLLFSFNGGFSWTGLALDPFNNTLLALEDQDTVYEFRTDGTLVGRPIATDQIADNGQGLAYDPSTGTLYSTSQAPGIVTLFQDSGRAASVIPEPSALALIATGVMGLFGYRCRRGMASRLCDRNL